MRKEQSRRKSTGNQQILRNYTEGVLLHLSTRGRHTNIQQQEDNAEQQH